MDSQEDEAMEPAVLNTAANKPTGIEIEIEADATLGYASIQNSVPVVRSLRLINHGLEPLEGVEVLITCNPNFAQGVKLRFDKLAPSESRRISPIDLHPDHTFLADLKESVNAVVTVRQHVLEGLGWRIHRIWSTDWWLNPEAEVEKLILRLEAILASDMAVDEEPLVIEEAVVEPQTSEEALRPESACTASMDTVQTSAVKMLFDSPALLLYAAASLPAGDPVKFYDQNTAQALTAQLQHVIEIEGPVPEQVLLRRVARAWGLERTGSRIVERLRNLVPTTAGRTVEGASTFYWPATVNSSDWCTFRLANHEETSRRHVDDICIEELGNVVRHVLKLGGISPRQDIARSVCRLVGMARTPADAEARVGNAIDHLTRAGKIAEVNGVFRLYTD